MGESSVLEYTLIDLEMFDTLDSYQSFKEDDVNYEILYPFFKESELSGFYKFIVDKKDIKRPLPVYTLSAVGLLWLSILLLASLIERKDRYYEIMESLTYLSKGVIRTVKEKDDLSSRYNYALSELDDIFKKNAFEEEQKMKFLSKLSHELKTPIATIKAYVDGLKYIDNKEKKEVYLDVIQDTMEQLSQRVNELFQLAQGQMNQFKYNLEDVYIKAYFETVFSRLKDDRLMITNHITDCLLTIDPTRIEQVIQNLFTNAVKHADDLIEIKAYRENDWIVIDMLNDGHKVDIKDMPFIFDFYYQGKASRKSDYDGAGIGLAICKEIMSVHHGTISIASGEFTKLTIKLPIE
jgi:signal transduction histidine kinase